MDFGRFSEFLFFFLPVHSARLASSSSLLVVLLGCLDLRFAGRWDRTKPFILEPCVPFIHSIDGSDASDTHYN
ncbi:hypothetical protein DTO212C5_5033 [Paecilomyces variotii]|nr:hypothetical protein DTO212C5_5033 [Paecilomyces variotii]